jgi:hypothetical protein
MVDAQGVDAVGQILLDRVGRVRRAQPGKPPDIDARRSEQMLGPILGIEIKAKLLREFSSPGYPGWR